MQINRVVRNPGPAIAGGTITSTHKENELLADIRLKHQKLHELTGAKKSDDLSEDVTKQLSIKTNFSLNSSPSSMTASPNELTPNQYKSSPQISQRTSIYDNIDDNSSNSSSQIEQTKTGAPSLPPLELLCPFEDTDKNERHLMKNAVIAPCCGYFICCEECKLFKTLFNFSYFYEMTLGLFMGSFLKNCRGTGLVPRLVLCPSAGAAERPQEILYFSLIFAKNQA